MILYEERLLFTAIYKAQNKYRYGKDKVVVDFLDVLLQELPRHRQKETEGGEE